MFLVFMNFAFEREGGFNVGHISEAEGNLSGARGARNLWQMCRRFLQEVRNTILRIRNGPPINILTAFLVANGRELCHTLSPASCTECRRNSLLMPLPNGYRRFKVAATLEAPTTIPILEALDAVRAQVHSFVTRYAIMYFPPFFIS